MERAKGIEPSLRAWEAREGRPLPSGPIRSSIADLRISGFSVRTRPHASAPAVSKPLAGLARARPWPQVLPSLHANGVARGLTTRPQATVAPPWPCLPPLRPRLVRASGWHQLDLGDRPGRRRSRDTPDDLRYPAACDATVVVLASQGIPSEPVSARPRRVGCAPPRARSDARGRWGPPGAAHPGQADAWGAFRERLRPAWAARAPSTGTGISGVGGGYDGVSHDHGGLQAVEFAGPEASDPLVGRFERSS